MTEKNAPETNETPDTTSETNPDVATEVTPEVTPEVASKVTPEVASKVTPEVTSKVTPEVTSKVTPEVTSKVTPEVASKVTPEVASKVTPEVTPEVTPKSTPKSTPKAKPVSKEPKAKVEETPTAVATETKPATAPKTTPQDGHWWWGTGRRKAAVARVRIRPGTGEFIVNKKDLTDYFSELRDHKDIIKVLEKTNTKGSLDVFVNTNGGGYTGQGGAIILGLGRALAKYDPSLDGVLRSNGYLSRDPRRVERKKPGQPGARKRFQFSKR